MKQAIAAALTSVVICVLPTIAQSATVDTVWTRTFYEGYFDSTNCVTETSDGGFLIVGMTRDEGESQTDINLIKTDSDGNLDWSIELGDTASECGFHVLECVEGGYLISAQSTKWGSGSGGTWIIRTNASGDTLWTFPFAPEDRNGFPLYAIQTADSGFAIAGLVNLPGVFNDAYILLLDKDGGYRDYAHYGDEHYQDGRFITEMADGGFIVAVWTNDPYSTQTDFRAFRTTSGLAVVWDSTYALSASNEELYSACRVEDGVVLVGNSVGIAHVMKIDFDGHTVYSKSISITPYDERPYSVCPTEDGGLMVGGWVNVSGHRRDFCFIKLDSDLDTLWSFTVGASQDDHGHAVLQTSDGGYVMAGTSYSFFSGACHYLAKIEQTFNTITGSDVEVPLDSVTVTFDHVTGEGDTELSVDSDGPPLPGEYQILPVDPPAYYDVSTSATYDGNIEICIQYDPDKVIGDEADLLLLHYDGGGWTNIRSSLDETNNVICGTTTTLSPFALAVLSPVSVDDEDSPLPESYSLAQNYPNPFNSSTSIEFTLPVRCRVELTVFDLLGRKIVTLLHNTTSAGVHRAEWDGNDANGNPVASGTYLYRLRVGNSAATKKMLLLK